MKIRATVGGAISLVNAIATGRGATLGTHQHATVVVEAAAGTGITLHSKQGSISSRLVNKTVQRILPRRILDKNRIDLQVDSDIPAGYGLKSSSAISSAVSLGCARLFGMRADDRAILEAGVRASLEAGVSITGAYDDACACYYGGFNVTDNLKKSLITRRRASQNLVAVILIPVSRKRCSPRRLKMLRPVFKNAWDLARDGKYWDAMILNGIAASTALESNPHLVPELLDKGALGASVSGNGPAIAAITRKNNISGVKKVLAKEQGRIIISDINNKKAEAHEV